MLSSTLFTLHDSARLLISSGYELSSAADGVNRRGLSTQPWGAPVEEVRLPIRTLLGLLVRKSKIQLPSAVLKPRVISFPISFEGEIVLNAELKSTNSIPM